MWSWFGTVLWGSMIGQLPGVYVACSDELSDVCSVAMLANGLVGFAAGNAIGIFELLVPCPGAGCDVTGAPPSISLKSSCGKFGSDKKNIHIRYIQ